jgi:hypothetical protein
MEGLGLGDVLVELGPSVPNVPNVPNVPKFLEYFCNFGRLLDCFQLHAHHHHDGPQPPHGEALC